MSLVNHMFSTMAVAVLLFLTLSIILPALAQMMEQTIENKSCDLTLVSHPGINTGK